MADVSVHFPIGNDSEVVLNLSVPRALLLIETIARTAGGRLAPSGPGQTGDGQSRTDPAGAWPGR